MSQVVAASPPRCTCETHDLLLWQPDPGRPSLVFGFCVLCSGLFRVGRQRATRGSTEPEGWRVLKVTVPRPMNAAS